MPIEWILKCQRKIVEHPERLAADAELEMASCSGHSFPL
jgi:hypothetical protein